MASALQQGNLTCPMALFPFPQLQSKVTNSKYFWVRDFSEDFLEKVESERK
jgi:hypothetical protein